MQSSCVDAKPALSTFDVRVDGRTLFVAQQVARDQRLAHQASVDGAYFGDASLTLETTLSSASLLGLFALAVCQSQFAREHRIRIDPRHAAAFPNACRCPQCAMSKASARL